MRRVLTKLLIVTTLGVCLSGCATWKKSVTEEETKAKQEIRWLENENCWCISDEDTKLLFKEAIRND